MNLATISGHELALETDAADAVSANAIVMIPTPYCVVIDTREQLPFSFSQPLRSPQGKLLVVQTTRHALASGDYSLAGYEMRVTVERKSAADLFSTFGTGRKRFVRELDRLASYQFAAVVVEAELSEILAEPPERSRLVPKTVFHSIVAWQQRYPNVHWWMTPGRAVAEVVTVRILDRFWREQQLVGK